jgi:hypothetical protein
MSDNIIRKPRISDLNDVISNLNEVDEILTSFEDWMHGEESRDCTVARKKLIDCIEFLTAQGQNDEG